MPSPDKTRDAHNNAADRANLAVVFNSQERKIIDEAAGLYGLRPSTFLRMIGIRFARQAIREDRQPAVRSWDGVASPPS